jgi:heme oxygenase
MQLREATRHNHDRAENTALSQLMVSGTMRTHTYAAYLENIMKIYAELERDGMITQPKVLRYTRLCDDLSRVGGPRWPTADSITRYVRYLASCDRTQRWAHAYVHYLGAMYGGQMIGPRLPGAHSHLEFEDIKNCVAYLRENLQGVDPDEANRAFEWTIDIYDELHRLFG